MTLIVQSANSIGTGVRVNLTTTADTYDELSGISVVSTDGSGAIFSGVASANDVLQISGTVTGGNGINFTASSAQLFLTNNAGGYISGLSNAGVQASGLSLIANYGQILGVTVGASLATGTFSNYGTVSASGPVGLSEAIVYSSQGTVYNFGTIDGTIGVFFAGTSAGNFLYNSGTIRSAIGIIDDAGSAGSTDTIYNAGTMVAAGFAAFQDNGQGALNFFNSGSITGNVDLGGGTNLFDSTLGTVSGTISGGGTNNTIVGGTTGGTLNGNVGSDILYANPTQTAANNAAHTTLNGAGGSNALYGDGAFTTFIAGNNAGGYNQIWGGASEMANVAGTANNTLSFAGASHGIYVDLLNGHNAFVGSTTDWTGAGAFEDSIVNVPNVLGSAHGDLVQADHGIDRITGGGGANSLYAGAGSGSQDTFVYTAYADSNTVTGYDTIVGFKLGIDRIDLSAFNTDPSHLAISTAGTSNTVYLETTPGTFNQNTDLAMIVNTTATGGLHTSDFVF